jgi:hypothetical protein
MELIGAGVIQIKGRHSSPLIKPEELLRKIEDLKT